MGDELIPPDSSLLLIIANARSRQLAHHLGFGMNDRAPSTPNWGLFVTLPDSLCLCTYRFSGHDDDHMRNADERLKHYKDGQIATLHSLHILKIKRLQA